MPVVPFTPRAVQPHSQGLVGCQLCGHLWAAVWPTVTPVRQLECPRCHTQGQTVLDPPRTQEPLDG